MNSVRSLYERFRQLIHEGAKFGVVGGIGFVVADGGTNLLQSTLHLGWLKSNVIATLAATIITYLGSRYWTFRHRERGGMGRETVLFFGLNGIGLGIQLACLGFTNYALGLTDKFASNVALFLGICLGTLFRFWSYRKWVWIAPTAGPVLDPAEFAAAELSPTQSSATAPRSAGVGRIDRPGSTVPCRLSGGQARLNFWTRPDPISVRRTSARLWTSPHMQFAVRVHPRMIFPIDASDHYFTRIGKGNAAIVTIILLDANREQASIVNLLPLVHACIQPTHRRILEINKVAFIHV